MPSAEELHISSFLVHARSDAVDRVAAAMAALDGVEVHGRSEAGKIVVTLESPGERAIVECLAAIRELPGVLSAVLVFHQIEANEHREAEPCSSSSRS